MCSSVDCSEKRASAVCGSDGVTYRNKCQLHQETTCKGISGVTISHRGECSEGELISV